MRVKIESNIRIWRMKMDLTDEEGFGLFARPLPFSFLPLLLAFLPRFLLSFAYLPFTAFEKKKKSAPSTEKKQNKKLAFSRYVSSNRQKTS